MAVPGCIMFGLKVNLATGGMLAAGWMFELNNPFNMVPPSMAPGIIPISRAITRASL